MRDAEASRALLQLSFERMVCERLERCAPLRSSDRFASGMNRFGEDGRRSRLFGEHALGHGLADVRAQLLGVVCDDPRFDPASVGGKLADGRS